MKDVSKYFTKNQIVEIERFLFENKLIESINNDLKINQFTNGFSNLTYQLSIDSKKFVLRTPPRGAIKRGHDMKREFKVLSNLYSVFKKIPKAYCYSDNIEIIGVPFYIMEKIEGIILTNQEVKKRNISENEYKKISNLWLDTLIELHETNYKNTDLIDFGKPIGYVERQVKNWSKQFLNSSIDYIPEADKVMKWLYKNQPLKYDSCIIHNDFKYDNLIFKNSKWDKIRAVLDWEMCTVGDPLMDLGTSLAYWTNSNDKEIIIGNFKSPTSNRGNLLREEIINTYSLKSGRAINNLTFYYAFGLFKISVIVQQIYFRYKKGFTDNIKFSELNKAADFFCKMSWKSIQKNEI